MWDLWWINLALGRFSQSISVSLTNHNTDCSTLVIIIIIIIIRAGTIGQIVADVPSGLSLTPPQEIKNEKKIWEMYL
jgi:hypothetical protein